MTSFNTANTAGSNVVPITSYQYQNVGIQVDITPRVHHNEEISLDLEIEVSDLSGQIGDQPIIGSRNIKTSIRLRDGETNFLAGLIRTNESNTQNGIPGLSEIPVAGPPVLQEGERQQAHRHRAHPDAATFIRRADITEQDLAPIWVGTEQNVVFRGSSPRIDSGIDGPFDEPPDESDETRLQLEDRLPPGLRNAAPEADTGEEGDDQPPLGVELVPPPGSPLQNAGLLERPPAIVPALFRPSSARTNAEIELSFAPQALRVTVGDSFEARLDIRARTPLSHLPLRLPVRPGADRGDRGQGRVLPGRPERDLPDDRQPRHRARSSSASAGWAIRRVWPDEATCWLSRCGR